MIRIDSDGAKLLELLPTAGRILVQGCSGASDHLAALVANAGPSTGPLHFTGVQVPGVNRASWLAKGGSRFTTFFMTPTLRAAGPQVTLLPLSYTDIGHHLRTTNLSAAMFSVSPPDSRGVCSFGPTVDFLPDLWRRIPLRIAHINPLLPRTDGPTGIPFDELHAVLEAPAAVPEMADAPADATSAAVARRLAPYIADGATLQLGLGKLPAAILSALKDRRRLRIHTGLISDPILDLLESGAIEGGACVVTGVALGSRRLYDALPGSGIRFHPVSHTHDLGVLAGLPGLITINSAMQVDLYGQAYAEVSPDGWNSGPGGATDFARGARAAQGLRVLALPASAGRASRIVGPGQGMGPVSLGRGDTDVVVTEHGSADLRGTSHQERAARLIAIAAPEHQDALAQAWAEGPGQY